MESACIDEISQLSSTIVITVPNSAQMENINASSLLNNDSEFIMLNNNEPIQETIKINHIWSISNNREKKPQKLNNSIFTCNKCPFKGNNQKSLICHMKIHKANCENNSNDKLMQEHPNNIMESVNHVLPQTNELKQSLKRKLCNVSYFLHLILFMCLVPKTN